MILSRYLSKACGEVNAVTLGVSNTDISKYPHKQRTHYNTYHIFMFISIPFISNYWYLKVNFLVPENLLWDIRSLRWTSTLRYRELTVYALIVKLTLILSMGDNSLFCIKLIGLWPWINFHIFKNIVKADNTHLCFLWWMKYVLNIGTLIFHLFQMEN